MNAHPRGPQETDRHRIAGHLQRLPPSRAYPSWQPRGHTPPGLKMALVEPCVCPESTGVKRMGPAFAV